MRKTNTNEFDVYSDTLGASVIHAKEDGNVGIGTTAPTTLLELGKAGTLGTLGLAGSTSGLVTVQPAATAGTWTMTLPADDGTNGYLLKTDGNGVTSWVAPGTVGTAWSSLTAPSTNLALTMGANTSTFTYNATTGASNLFSLTDTASNTGTGFLMDLTTAASSVLNPLHVKAAGTEALTVTKDARVGIGTTAPGSALDVKGTVRLSGATSGYVGLATAAAAGSTTYTLPSSDGSSGQAITTNGSGTLSWTNAGVFTKDAHNTIYSSISGNGTMTGGDNFFTGYNAGHASTSGGDNNFIGYNAGYSNTEGLRNNFIGYQPGYSNTTGDDNNFIGYNAGYLTTTGDHNTFIGYQAGHDNTIGHDNNYFGYETGHNNTEGSYNDFIGYHTGYSNTTGSENVALGYNAGFSNSTGSGNVFIGPLAGFYETGSNAFYVDNQDRTNTAGDKAKALLYGVFSSTAANQTLRVNAQLTTLGSVGIGTTAPAQMLDISSTAPSFQMSDTTPSAKSLRLVTDSNVASFYEAAGAAGDILSLDLANKRVGIGTTAPLVSFQITNGSVLFTGSTGDTPTSGIGTRMMWIPDKYAFRAGYVGAAQWDDANIGAGSFAAGSSTTASGPGSVALGITTTASQYYAVASGFGTVASGYGSFAGGRGVGTFQTTSSGYGTFAFGCSDNTSAIGITAGTSSTYGSIAMGYASASHTLSATGTGSVAIGQDVNAATNDNVLVFGKDFTETTANSFNIGFGQLDYQFTATLADCKNSNIVTTGNVGIGTTAPTSPLQVVGLPVYANNAAAVAGGLTAGAFYRTGGDPDPVCVVH